MEFKKYEPCANPVVVRILDGQEMVGSIVVPEMARQKTDFGEVVFSNKQAEGKFPVGTIVHLRSYSGAEFEFNGQRLLSVGIEEILGKLS